MNKNKIKIKEPNEYEVNYAHATTIFRSKKDLNIFHDFLVQKINDEIKKAKRIKRIQNF